MVRLNKIRMKYKVKVGSIVNILHPEVLLARAAIRQKNLTSADISNKEKMILKKFVISPSSLGQWRHYSELSYWKEIFASTEAFIINR